MVVSARSPESDRLETLAHELTLAQVGIARFIIEPEGGIPSRDLADEASSILLPVAPKAAFGVAGQLDAAGGEIPVRSIESLPLRGWRAALERERLRIVGEIGDDRPFATR